ncbi:hypothetical protein F5B19DRAFT_500451 [Rostrohypoxylon terebratum]|nr:hypothetical protein F5B19DRAFT_500451 [Rostrohypoxylon terebratum]
MARFTSDLESTPEEHSTKPCTANLSDVLGQEIEYEDQPRRIQKMIHEASDIENQLLELFQATEDPNSTAKREFSMKYLHLFKEYSSVVHNIDRALYEKEDQSASPELLVRWAIMIFKTTERMIGAVSMLAKIEVDEENPRQTCNDINAACKAIFEAYETMDRVEYEVTEACPLDAADLDHLARNTRIVRNHHEEEEEEEEDEESDEERTKVYSDAEDDYNSDFFERDDEGYLNLDNYEFSVDDGHVILKVKDDREPSEYQ